MNLIDIISLAFALAMDCFAVSIVCGVIKKRFVWGLILRMSLLFGLFQAMMPFFGWFGISYFSIFIEPVDHWIAFGLLLFIGIKMIKDSSEPDEEAHFNPDRIRTLLVLAVATSIDALAVGISFACIGYRSISDMYVPLTVIGLVSFGMSVTGYALGVKFGKAVSRQLHAEFLGGVILIFIGIKILMTHLFYN